MGKNYRTVKRRKAIDGVDSGRLQAEAEARLASLVACGKEEDAEVLAALIDELQMRQSELVRQNEALRESRLDLEEFRERCLNIYDSAPIGYLTHDGNGLISEANLTAATILGMERSRLQSFDFDRFVNPECRERWHLHLSALRQRCGEKQVSELLLQREDHSLFFARLESALLQKADGSPLMFTTLTDISLRKQAEDLVASVLDSVNAGFVIVNRDFRIVSANRVYAASVGLCLGEVIGRRCHSLSHHSEIPCHLEGLGCAVKHVFETGEAKAVLHTHYDAEGRPIHTEIKAFPLRTNDGSEVQTAIEVIIDVTEKKTSEAEIHQMAFHDPLTRLPNRRLLLDRLGQAFTGSARTGQHGAVLFLDLDNFKVLNDTRGHDVGDLLLTIAADRLQVLVRDGDTVSRQGGDEFVVLLENLSSVEGKAVSQAWHVAEKIRSTLVQPYDLKGGEYHSTASIGICLFRGHEIPAHDLLIRADTAMYQAKHAGRNAVCFFDPAMQEALEAANGLEADLRQAIEGGQFQLYYQPQTDGRQQVIGAEALLRWPHLTRGMVSPASFIPLAEESGLIVDLGRWVLEEACRRLSIWAAMPAACDLRLAVNVSARQFRQPDFVTGLRRIIMETGADPSRLKLELTEALVLADATDTVAKMRELRDMGIGFFMDDFGTGYSSLSLLKSMPLDQLKIDQSFIRDLGNGSHDTAVVETIIAMGQALGIRVIAEGVENEEQLAFLNSHGCHAYQGYLFSRPLPAKDFEDMLTSGFAGSLKN